MLETTSEYLVSIAISAIVIVLFVRGNILRPYYYYKYSDHYYKSQRWLKADEAIKEAEKSGEEIKLINNSFVKLLPILDRFAHCF